MLKQFYSDVLPSQGEYCLFFGETKRHLWFDSLDSLVAGTLAQGDTKDVYFATASFDDAKTRKSENVLFKRAICLDVDAGPEKWLKHGDKVYPTQRDALAAVVQWCKTNALSPTYIISSGAGLHVYFALDEDTPVAEWQPVALALKAKALADGLRNDAMVVGNPVLVLRPVGTTHKSGAEVAVIYSCQKRYSIAALASQFHAAPVRKRERSINADLLENAYVGPPRSVVKIIKQCGAMRYVADVRGDVPEPYWRAMLGLVKFTVEGDEGAHLLSQGHPDYDYDDTQDKLDRWKAGPTTCGTFEAENPQACAGCAYRGNLKSPILLGSMTDVEVKASPEAQQVIEERIEAVEAAAVAGPTSDSMADDGDEDGPRQAPWTDNLPDDTLVDRAGRLCMWKQVKVDNDDGTTSFARTLVAFSTVPYWFTQWADAETTGDEAVLDMMIYKAAQNRTTTYRMPMTTVAKRDTLMTLLARYSILPMNSEAKALHEDYVRACMERIRRTGLRPKITDRLGTDFGQDKRMFVSHGNLVVKQDGSIDTGIVADRLTRTANGYVVDLPETDTGVWAAKTWEAEMTAKAKRHVEFLHKHYALPGQAPFRLAIALSWASPLMAFTQGGLRPGGELDAGGFTVSLYSTGSGRGKSHAQFNAALAFGDPNKLVQQRDTASATAIARMHAVACAGTLPVFMDEMGDAKPEDTASMVRMVANGASRERMDKEFKINGGSRNSLVNLMSTNKSARELIAIVRTDSPAEQVRILEINCEDVPDAQGDGSYVTDRNAVQDCRGAVGLILHGAMVRLGYDAVNKLVLECVEKARIMVGEDQEGRFLWRAFGACLAMRRMLRAAGITLFDVDDLASEFKKWYRAGYQFAADNTMPTDGPTLVNLMLSSMTGKTLYTEHLGSRDNKVNVPLNERIPDYVVARSVLSERVIYVSVEAVREWARERKTSYGRILQIGRDSGVFEPVEPGSEEMNHRVNLYAGTKLSQGSRLNCLRVRTTLLGDAEVALGNVTPLRSESGTRQTPRASASA